MWRVKRQEVIDMWWESKACLEILTAGVVISTSAERYVTHQMVLTQFNDNRRAASNGFSFNDDDRMQVLDKENHNWWYEFMDYWGS